VSAPDDYEAYAYASRARFLRVIDGAMILLVWGLYLPWVLVAQHALTKGTAEIITCFSGLLLLLSSPVLLAPRGRSILGVTVVGELVVFCAVSWLMGWIGAEGLRWSIMLCVLMGMMTAYALAVSAVRGR
jgi:hypothetical protein